MSFKNFSSTNANEKSPNPQVNPKTSPEKEKGAEHPVEQPNKAAPAKTS